MASALGGHAVPLEQMPVEPIGENVYRLRGGKRSAEGSQKTVLVCCSVTFAHAGMQPLLDLVLRGAAMKDPTLTMILDAMSAEIRGHATVMARLADVLVTRVIRDWAESRRDDAEGWLAAVRDPRIGRAIAAVHQRPGDPWSLESLSRVAKVSRSVFAERFTSIVGVPPARYVAQWRMRLATEWLREGKTTVAEASTRLGYDSEAAFSRAFKRFVGRPPSAVRREGRA